MDTTAQLVTKFVELEKRLSHLELVVANIEEYLSCEPEIESDDEVDEEPRPVPSRQVKK